MVLCAAVREETLLALNLSFGVEFGSLAELEKSQMNISRRAFFSSVTN